MGAIPPFSSLIPGWPEAAPQDGADLILFEDDAIEELGLDEAGFALVTGVRRHLRLAALARGSSTQLTNATAVVEALDSGDLRVYPGRWLTVVLDRHRRRVFAPQRDQPGTSRGVVHLSKWVPDPCRLPQLPEGGVYLLLWGGTADVLEIEDVRVRLRRLGQEMPIADVIFRSRPVLGDGSAIGPTTWSLREEIGVRDGASVPFPDPTLLEEVSLWTP